MKKFIKNFIKLILIKTPLFILKNFIKNFLKNYYERKKSKNLEKNLYKDFITQDENSNWFCYNLQFLVKNLPSLNSSLRVKKILEIGSFEGRSAIFFLSYFNNSSIDCVDTWEGSDEHNKKIFSKIESNFDQNTLKFVKQNKLKKFKQTSDFFFKKNNELYDLIYIDGDHDAAQVSKDLKNSWNCLKNGGVLVLDDYLWWFYKDLRKNPSTPINSFLSKYKNSISELIIWNQVLIEKKL